MLETRGFHLPMVAQSLDFTCGAACFESVFRYFRGRSPGEMYFAEELGSLRLGMTPPENVFELAKKYGFDAVFIDGGGIDDLRREFQAERVIFVTWWDEDAGHYSLIRWIDEKEVILMDPWAAREGRDTPLLLEEFERHWKVRGARAIGVRESHGIGLE